MDVIPCVDAGPARLVMPDTLACPHAGRGNVGAFVAPESRTLTKHIHAVHAMQSLYALPPKLALRLKTGDRLRDQ